MIEIIALVVAICAFVVSIATPIFEFFWNRKMNRHNLKAEYFKEIYGKMLYEDIPVALNYIHYDGNNVTGTENLCDVLRKIRMRSIYFKFYHREFYDKLIHVVQDLENYIVQSPESMTTSNFNDFYNSIHNKVEVIYKHMGNEYTGKKL